MGDKDNPKKPRAKDDAVKVFLIHLAIFIVVNLFLLFVPVFYDREIVFDFEERAPMFYGSIGWGIGVFIHGFVVFISKAMSSSK